MVINSGDKMTMKWSTLLHYKNTTRLIPFVQIKEYSSPLFKYLKMLKLEYIIIMNIIPFTHSNNNTPVIFWKYFDFKELNHQQDKYTMELAKLNLSEQFCQSINTFCSKKIFWQRCLVKRNNKVEKVYKKETTK